MLSHFRSFNKIMNVLLGAFFLLLSCVTRAQNPRATEQALSPQLSVVEVRTANTVGNGILFILDGRLRVLTNAHVIEEGGDIQLKFSTHRILNQVSVETSLNVDDLAVLVIPDNPELRSIAEHTFQVCTSRPNGLCNEAVKSTFAQEMQNYSGEDSLVFFSKGLVTEAKPQTTLRGFEKVEDDYISGTYKYVWLVRALVKDGVSGGGYFHLSEFAGLLTKISKGMQSTAIAIPTEEIARVLTEHKAATSGPIRLAQKTGGDTGNGGGQLNETENKEAEPLHWSLKEIGCSGFRCESQAQIVNPFHDAMTDTSIQVNGQKAAFIYQSNWTRFLFQSATAPRYNRFVSLKTSFKLFDLNNPAIKKLMDKRQTSFLNVPHLRVWKKTAAATLQNNYPVTGAFHDGIINLYNLDRKLDSSRRMYVGNFGPNIGVGTTADTSFQIVLEEQNQRILVARDLSRIWVGQVDATSGEFMQVQPLMNPVKRLYKSESGQSRALMIYNEADLSRLESLIVDTSDYVYEFTLIDPNTGFGQ